MRPSAPPLARAGLSPLPPTDPVASLAACHAKIRQYLDGVARLAALPDPADPRIGPAALSAYRYLSVGLPLHAADEDDSIAPRLATRLPSSQGLLDDLEQDHARIVARLAQLVPLLRALAQETGADREALGVEIELLSGVLLPHLEREERELFPLMAALTDADRVEIGRELLGRRG